MAKNKCYRLHRRIYKWISTKLRGPSRKVGVSEEKSDPPKPVLQKHVSELTDSEIQTEGIGNDKSERSLVYTDSIETPQEFATVLLIPFHCRATVYELVDYADVLRLRLVCKQFLYELNHCRGVKVQLDDSVYDYDWFKHLGVGTLIVRHFRNSDSAANLLSQPSLLKDLVITGSITAVNFNSIVLQCQNIQNLALEMSPYTLRYGFKSFDETSHLPGKLQTLRITAFMYDAGDALRAGENILPVLINVRCSTLRHFAFQICMIDSHDVHSFHLEALKLISAHVSTLKSIQVYIKQIFHSFSDEQLDSGNYFIDIRETQLDEIRLSLDRHFTDWYPLIRSSPLVATLELNLRNFRWSTIIPTITQCDQTLKNLQVYRVNSRNGRFIYPIDIEVLRNCLLLEKLTIHHIPHSPIFMPKMSKTVHLPLMLQEVDLSRIALKQHQILFILLRLPVIHKLSLAYWMESTLNLTELLSVLSIVIKFNVSSIKHITMIDLRTKFLSHESAISRISDFLESNATLRISETTREKTLLFEVKQ